MKELNTNAIVTTATNTIVATIEEIERISTINIEGEIITLLDVDKKEIIDLLSEVQEQLNNKEEIHKITIDSIMSILFMNYTEGKCKSETFKKLIELKGKLIEKKDKQILDTFRCNEGLNIFKNFIIKVERNGNTPVGNPRYLVEIFNKSGDSLNYYLKYKKIINYRLLKNNKFSISSYNMDDTIKNIFNNLIEASKMEKILQ